MVSEPKALAQPKDRKPGFRDRLEFALFRFVLGVLQLLPYSVAESILRGLSVFAGCVLGIRRKVALWNLERVFPDRSSAWYRRVLRSMWEHLGSMMAEVYLSKPGQIESRVRCVGLEHLRAFADAGQGSIAVTAHFGNWELAGRYASSVGIPSCLLVKLQRNPLFDRFTNDLRLEHGITTIHKHKSLRSILAMLRRGYVIALASDQDARREGVRMNFLGHPASVYTGPIRIALKTGAPLVPLFIVREKDNTHTMHIHPPIHTKGIEETPEVILEITGRINRIMEDHIRKNPGLWFWMHRRWKSHHKAIPPEEFIARYNR